MERLEKEAQHFELHQRCSVNASVCGSALSDDRLETEEQEDIQLTPFLRPSMSRSRRAEEVD
jgi:hypothetical protein